MNYILFFFLFNTLSHYEGNPPEMIQLNNIAQVKCYNYTIEDGQVLKDSVLTVERNFNKAGLPLDIIIYADYTDDKNIGSIYEYQYDNDTTLSIRNTYLGDEKILRSKTIYKYNENNQQISSESYNIEKDKLEALNTLEYNKDNQLSKQKWVINGELIGTESYKYNGHGRLNEVLTKLNKKNKFRIYYTPYGKKSKVFVVRKIKGRKRRGLVAEYRYNENQELDYSKVYSCCKQKIIGVKGRQILLPRDIVEREIDYLGNGLIKEEREIIHGKLAAVKRYYYH